MLEYSQADVNITRALHINFHNREIDKEINRIRNLMDMCDDIQMREQYARRLNRLKRKKL